MSSRILVVDDAQDTLEVLHRNLSSKGYQVFTALDVLGAIRLLDTQAVDLIITDLKMPGASGLELIRHVRANYKDTEIIMITGYATVEGAVQAVKMGAEEYLSKPFTQEELLSAVHRALDKFNLRRIGRLSAQQNQWASFGLIGESEAMLKVFSGIAQAVSCSKNILIKGERGTGRELVARAIHLSSSRAKQPFLNINCENLSDQYLTHRLLGQTPSFSENNLPQHPTLLELTTGGTIYFSEIGFASLSMQTRMINTFSAAKDSSNLNLGQDHQPADVRLIASTSEDLSFLMSRRAFRQELFFIAQVITIEVPPLRERKHDILLLANYFAEKLASDCGRSPLRFSDDTLHVLQSYNWPGNLRELRSLIRRLVLTIEGDVVDIPDLPPSLRFRFAALSDLGVNARTLEEVEAEHIRNVLVSVEGNKSRAAEILGINRKTLWDKLKRYALND